MVKPTVSPDGRAPTLNAHHVLVLHCRGMEGDSGDEAHLQLLAFVQKYAHKDQRIHLHYFTGIRLVMEQWIKAFPNICFGFTKAVTRFRDEQLEALRHVHEHRILLETDAPYFPLRGNQFSMPGHLMCVVREVARKRGVTTDHLLGVANTNARRLYWT